MEQLLFEVSSVKKTAVISECGKYRYELSRIWDDKKPKVLFLMLNPSTADANEDDPTIRRCIRFAKDWGYGGLMVGNLFAFRSTDPKNLKYVTEHNHHINSEHLMNMYWQCEITVCAWGNPPIENNSMPLTGFKNLHYLALTQSFNPKHPLYLKADLKPVKYEYKRYF